MCHPTNFSANVIYGKPYVGRRREHPKKLLRIISNVNSIYEELFSITVYFFGVTQIWVMLVGSTRYHTPTTGYSHGRFFEF